MGATSRAYEWWAWNEGCGWDPFESDRGGPDFNLLGDLLRLDDAEMMAAVGRQIRDGHDR